MWFCRFSPPVTKRHGSALSFLIPAHLKLGLSRQSGNRNSQHLLDANVALSAIIVELVEKGVGCFRIDPPSALRRWAGGFRFVVSATFPQKQRRKTFRKRIIFIAGALPPAPPPAFEKAGPKLYFFYSLAARSHGKSGQFSFACSNLGSAFVFGLKHQRCQQAEEDGGGQPGASGGEPAHQRPNKTVLVYRLPDPLGH